MKPPTAPTTMHRYCLPLPPPRDTVECAPDLDMLTFDDEAASGVRAIPAERAAEMRAEWDAAWTDPPTAPATVLDMDTAHDIDTAFPGGWR